MRSYYGCGGVISLDICSHLLFILIPHITCFHHSPFLLKPANPSSINFLNAVPKSVYVDGGWLLVLVVHFQIPPIIRVHPYQNHVTENHNMASPRWRHQGSCGGGLPGWGNGAGEGVRIMTLNLYLPDSTIGSLLCTRKRPDIFN